ncbi:MAG TPA: hypothetical protein VK666_14280 [Chryseolinea sp.]|nr:hypothetical protein [Chryseolinea sp.]
MDSDNLQKILQRYWSGDTTLEEEAQLREYFNGNNVPEELKETAALFRYFRENKKKSLSDISFDRVVIDKIHSHPVKRGKVVGLLYNATRIAAGVAVVMVATWFIRNEVRKTTPQDVVDTYDDPKLAFEETKKALMMISKSFGTAQSQTKKINMFNEAQEEIQRKKKDNL